MAIQLKTPWASIAKIAVDGEHSGTGFLVTRQHVLTALHVVADKSGQPFERIIMRFFPDAEFGDGSPVFETDARFIEEWSSISEDFAVLECLNPLPEQLKPLHLGGACRTEERFSSPGFGIAKLTGFTAIGTVSSSNDPFEGGVTVIGLQFDSGSGLPVKGHSGAPVIVNGCVVGLLRTAFLDEQELSSGGIVHAVRIQQVVLACGDLLKSAATGPIRWPALPSPSRAPVLADRKPEFELFQRMITGQSASRVLLLEGTTNSGKSVLSKELVKYARSLPIAVAYVDLKGCPELNGIFGAMVLDLGDEILPTARLAAGEPGLSQIIADLGGLNRPLLVALDTWEKSSDQTRNWIETQFLARLARMPGVVVLIAGQEVPDSGLDSQWSSLAVHRPLGPIYSVDDWMDYSHRKWPAGGFTRDHVEALAGAGEGIPGVISPSLARFIEPKHAALAARATGDGRG